ncbi:MAG: amino acid adenylation domain-containing protein [Methylorubrum populi]
MPENRLRDDRRAALARLLEEDAAADDAIPRRAGDGPAPLSFPQSRLWFLHRYDPDNPAYHSARAFRLRGILDEAALAAALSRLIERHDALRTVISDADGAPRQHVLPPADLAIARFAVTDDPERAIRAITRKPFDLTRDPPLRVALSEPEPDGVRVLVLVLHHIAGDAWSYAHILGDLTRAYRGALADDDRRGPPLPSPALAYADYALWQRARIESEGAQAALARWRAYLGPSVPVLELPVDRPRAPLGDRPGGRIDFAVDAGLADALTRFCRAEGATPFVVLLAAWQILLGRLSGQTDFCVGVPNAGRNRPELQDLVGFFVNMQVYRARLDPALSFRDVCARLRGEAMAFLADDDVPFERLIAETDLSRDLRHTPVFQSAFNFRPARDAAPLVLDGVRAEPLDADPMSAKFDLTLDVAAGPSGIDCRLEYDAGLIEARTAARWRGHFLTLLGALLARPGQALRDVQILGPAERDELDRLNTPPAEDTTPDLVAMLEAQRDARPGARAIVHAGGTVSHAELHGRADRLAARLRAAGIGPETRVAILLERSPLLFAAMLAVLKAGGAFMPLDPGLPPDRLGFLLRDGAPALLLTQASLAGPLDGSRLPTWLLATDEPDEPGPTAALPATVPHPENLAYLIHTSGSTGRPKGVAVARGALSMHVRAIVRLYAMRPDDLEVQVSGTGFDITQERWLAPLAAGGAVSLTPAPGIAMESWIAQARAAKVTVAFLPPAYANALVGALAGSGTPLPLRLCIVGGEAWGRRAAARAAAAFPGTALVNAYGPTETVIAPLAWPLRAGVLGEGQAPDGVSTPIGFAVGARTAWVLDDGPQPVPVGVAGELYLGGAGLARGYHGRPGATAERFVPDPFGPPGSRLYRTGDRVRRRTDGALEFLGRLDDQVKIRGFRIEPGEIAARLSEHPEVSAATVAAHDAPGGPRLVAYVVPDGAAPGRDEPAFALSAPLETALRAHLAAHLPDYMLPARFVGLARLPLTVNGKLDRAALPEPDWAATGAGDAEGLSEAETALAAIWSELLGVSRVSRHDNFFERGGDSILALQLVTRARRDGFHLTPRHVFEHQSLAALAAHLDACPPASLGDAEPETPRPVPPTPIQRWFLDTPVPNRHHWNQSLVLHPSARLAPRHLAQALHAVIRAHPALRLRFARDARGWHQTCAPVDSHAPEAVENLLGDGDGALLRLREAGDERAFAAIARETQTSLDLEDGPLLRAVLVRGPGPGERLFVAIHHLCVDAVSWRILIDDLETALADLAQGRPIALPAATTGFPSWARGLDALAHAPEHAGRRARWLAEWRACLAGPAATLAPARPEGADTEAERTHLRQAIDADATDALLRRAPKPYRTGIDEILLTALALGLTRHLAAGSASGPLRPVRIALESHGREADASEDGEAAGPRHDLSRSVGWFTSLKPLRLDPLGLDERAGETSGQGRPPAVPDEPWGDDTLGRALCRIKERLRTLPRPGFGHGLLRFCADPETRQALAEIPEPGLTLNYLGQMEAGRAGQAGSRADEGPTFALGSERPAPDRDEGADLGAEMLLTAQVRAGRLILDWSYSRARHDAAAVAGLAESCRDALLALIAHCADPATPGRLTPADLPLAGLDQDGIDAIAETVRRENAGALADLYPLSPLQQGLLFHAQHAPDTPHYRNQLRLDVENLDADRFAAALGETVRAHDALRTAILAETPAGRPLQAVLTEAADPVTVEDWSGTVPEEHDARLDLLAAAERDRGFDLARPPLLRLRLVRTGTARHHLILTLHHIVLDGWSTARLVAEWLERYRSGTASPPRGRFRDLIAWTARQDRARSEAFWRAQTALLDEPTLVADSFAPSAAAVPGAGDADLRLCLDEPAAARLLHRARASRLTLNTLVQAAWIRLIAARTGARSVCFGATVAGRPENLPGADTVLGLFINTLPVIVGLDPDRPLAAWLSDLQDLNLALREHGHVPLAEIQRLAGRSGRPLFDSLIVFENYPVGDALAALAGPGALRFGRLRSVESTHYPLTLTVHLRGAAAETADGTAGARLDLRLGYDPARVGADEARATLDQLATGLDALAAAEPDTPLGAIPALTHRPDEDEWNATARAFAPPASSVLDLIAIQVAARPGAIAVCDDSHTLSFAELDARSTRLARRLRAQGAGPDTLVGLALERGCALPTAVLAILKAGAAFLPMLPDLPRARLDEMVREAGLRLLLTDRTLAPALPDRRDHPDLAVITIEQDEEEHGLDAAPLPPPHPDSLAYCVYTSGSTGRPKGCANTHRALLNRLRWGQDDDPLGPDDVLLQKTPLSFDIAIYELLWPPMAGSRLAMAPPGAHRDPQALRALITRHRVSHVHFVPSMLAAFVAAGELDACTGLRRILCTGEALPPPLQEAVLARSPARLVNLYGPTEAAIEVTAWTCRSEPGAASVPIGHPIANTAIHLLDADLHPVPSGVAGELYIGGVGLARGYRGRAGTTAERFVPDPLGAPGARLYRTGDRARRRADGALEFLGRLDEQVKIRGFRIEPGEVAARLAGHAGVAAAAVIAAPAPGGLRLVAYVVPEGGAEATDAAAPTALDAGFEAALRAHLAVQLPDYMVPTRFVGLARLPLSANGKLDRRALPLPDWTGATEAEAGEAPRGETETALAAIWCAVLGLERVARHDNFFERGGDSILATRVVSRLRQEHGIELPLHRLFEAATLADLAAGLDLSGRAGAEIDAMSDLLDALEHVG